MAAMKNLAILIEEAEWVIARYESAPMHRDELLEEAIDSLKAIVDAVNG